MSEPEKEPLTFDELAELERQWVLHQTPLEPAPVGQWGVYHLHASQVAFFNAAVAALPRIRATVAAATERAAKVCEQVHTELDEKFSPEGCTDSALVAAERIRGGPP